MILKREHLTQEDVEKIIKNHHEQVINEYLQRKNAEYICESCSKYKTLDDFLNSLPINPNLK